MDGQDVFVYALEFRAALVVPAAGVVDETGGVVILYRGAYLLGVKLTPALVEGHPAADGDAVIEIVYHAEKLVFEFLSPFGLVALKALIHIILDMDVDIRKHAGKDVADILAAAYHILPHEHTEPVAVVIPPERLLLDMLAEHIVTELLHLLNVEYHCLVGRRGELALGPIALVEQTSLKIGLVIESEPRDTCGVLDYREFTHTEVA